MLTKWLENDPKVMLVCAIVSAVSLVASITRVLASVLPFDVAMGGIGSDIAVEAADAILVGDEIRNLPYLFGLSHRVMDKIRANIAASLIINLSAVVLSTLGSKVPALSWITANNSICLAGLVALCVVLAMTKADPKYAVVDGTRLMDNVGPTGILPQLLSALGSLFTAAGVGTVIANGVAAIVPEGNKLMACIVYCVAMALFTIIMGNGFAAFSVIS